MKKTKMPDLRYGTHKLPQVLSLQHFLWPMKKFFHFHGSCPPCKFTGLDFQITLLFPKSRISYPASGFHFFSSYFPFSSLSRARQEPARTSTCDISLSSHSHPVATTLFIYRERALSILLTSFYFLQGSVVIGNNVICCV